MKRLIKQKRNNAYDVIGEAEQRFLNRLGMPLSGDQSLNLIQNNLGEPDSNPQVTGGND